MDQGRAPPSYQEYPAAMLSNFSFRLIPLAARGLLYTMRLECWANRKLPRNPDSLAKVLGVSPAEVAALLPSVMPFFEIDGDFIFCPELEKYRAYLDERRRRQSEGGKRSADAKSGKRKTAGSRADKGDSSTLPSSLKVPRQGAGKSLVQNRPVQNSKNQSLGNGDLHDDFVDAYEQAESATAYRRASEGY